MCEAFCLIGRDVVRSDVAEQHFPEVGIDMFKVGSLNDHAPRRQMSNLGF